MYWVVIATMAKVVVSLVKIYHVFARKLTWYFTGVIIINLNVSSGKTEDRRLYSHAKKWL